jgi:hypothetical protein
MGTTILYIYIIYVYIHILLLETCEEIGATYFLNLGRHYQGGEEAQISWWTQKVALLQVKRMINHWIL